MDEAGVFALALLFPSMTQVATLLQQAMKHNFNSPALWSDRELWRPFPSLFRRSRKMKVLLVLGSGGEIPPSQPISSRTPRSQQLFQKNSPRRALTTMARATTTPPSTPREYMMIKRTTVVQLWRRILLHTSISSLMSSPI